MKHCVNFSTFEGVDKELKVRNVSRASHDAFQLSYGELIIESETPFEYVLCARDYCNAEESTARVKFARTVKVKSDDTCRTTARLVKALFRVYRRYPSLRE